VLVLRDIEGLSYEEIADITQAPLGTVEGALFRAAARPHRDAAHEHLRLGAARMSDDRSEPITPAE
jgi:DNA-directed RNA polymerase specialized sigma24 family protein